MDSVIQVCSRHFSEFSSYTYKRAHWGGIIYDSGHAFKTIIASWKFGKQLESDEVTVPKEKEHEK
jgi:hypothetical protein